MYMYIYICIYIFTYIYQLYINTPTHMRNIYVYYGGDSHELKPHRVEEGEVHSGVLRGVSQGDVAEVFEHKVDASECKAQGEEFDDRYLYISGSGFRV